MKINKKGVEGGAMTTVVALVILLFAAFILIGLTSKQGGQIQDAGDEIMSFTNIMNPNCDFDHDGLSGTADKCPCDHDAYFGSKTYYIIGTQCAVFSAARVFIPIKGLTDVTPLEGNDYVFMDLADTACNKVLISFMNGDNKDKYEVCKYEKPDATKYTLRSDAKVLFMDKLSYSGSSEKDVLAMLKENNDKSIVFNKACADLILSKAADEDRFVFTCKTATKDCKKKLASSKC